MSPVNHSRVRACRFWNCFLPSQGAGVHCAEHLQALRAGLADACGGCGLGTAGWILAEAGPGIRGPLPTAPCYPAGHSRLRPPVPVRRVREGVFP